MKNKLSSNSKLNVVSKYPYLSFSPFLYCLNTLTELLKLAFELYTFLLFIPIFQF